MIRSYLVAATLVACLFATAPAVAQFGNGNSANNLFSQYTTQNGNVTAGLYPAPHPAPYLGAHSYYTYQPLMPHEMMYQHSRNYYNYYNTGGFYGSCNSMNKTTVRWQSSGNHIGNLPLSTGLSKIHWRLGDRRYCIDGNCRPERRVRAHGCSTGTCGAPGCSTCGG